VCVSNGSEFQYCRKNFLSQQTLSNIEDLKGQLLVCLVDSGFLPLTEAERTALNRYVIHNTYPSVLSDRIERAIRVDDDNFSRYHSE
jgi:hypothetical protein